MEGGWATERERAFPCACESHSENCENTILHSDSHNSIGHATEILGNNLDGRGAGSPKHALYALHF